MGNRNVRLSVHLDTAGDSVRAGTRVQGTVIAKVSKAVVKGPFLLVIKGMEKTSMHDKHIFFEEKVELGEITSIGTHSFPFSVHLPESLPSSLYNGYGSILYKCIAQHGKAKSVRCFDVTAVVLWRDARKQRILGPISTERIMSTGFFSTKREMGFITYGVAVDDRRIKLGQYFILSIACRNNSTVDIHQRVWFRLVEEVYFKRSLDHGRYLYFTYVTAKIDWTTLLTLPEHAARRNINTEIQEERAGSLYPGIYDELRSGRNSARFRLPTNCGAHVSYGGELISVSHYIEVCLQTPLGIRDLKTRIRITIGDYASAEQTETAVAQAPLVPSTPVDDDADPLPYADVSVLMMRP